MMIRQRKIIKEQAEKLYQTYMEHGKLVVAYSFYETIFSKDGNNCEEVIKLLQLCKQAQIGNFICIDTDVSNKHSFVKTYCEERNIPLDKITDRVTYDIALDSKAGLQQAMLILQIALYKIVKNTNAF